MGEPLYAPERQTEILLLLQQQGRVSVSDLSDRFGVSAVTIRSDLSELERRGELVRTHGGAILGNAVLAGRDDVEPAFHLRTRLRRAQKEAIGAAAARRVGDGEAIVVDASTTALQVARHLVAPHLGLRHELTVLTNSVMVAFELAGVDGVTVVMTGGILRPVSYSLVGPIGRAALDHFVISKGFFGAKGLTVAEGLTDADSFEVQFKRAMVAACKEVIAVVDSSKWGQVAAAAFAPLERVDAVITDPGAPPDIVHALEARGIQVEIAHPPAGKEEHR